MRSVRGSDSLYWRTLYEAALLETQSSKLPQLIFEADCAVINRIVELKALTDNEEEIRALMRAVQVLRNLRRITQNDGV